MSDTLPQGFEILDHPADMGFHVWAPSREALFASAAFALTSILVDPDTIKEEKTIEVELEGEDEELLLYNWLSEVLFYFDGDGMLFSKFEIVDFMTTDSGFRIQAKLSGQEFSGETQQIKTYVKAITLHQLKVVRKSDSFEAQVYLDI